MTLLGGSRVTTAPPRGVGSGDEIFTSDANGNNYDILLILQSTLIVIGRLRRMSAARRRRRSGRILGDMESSGEEIFAGRASGSIYEIKIHSLLRLVVVCGRY